MTPKKIGSAVRQIVSAPSPLAISPRSAILQRMKDTLVRLLDSLPTTQNTLAFADVLSALGIDTAQREARKLPPGSEQRKSALRAWVDDALRARATLDTLGWVSNDRNEDLTRRPPPEAPAHVPVWAGIVSDVLASHPEWNGTLAALGPALEAHPSGLGSGASSPISHRLIREALVYLGRAPMSDSVELNVWLAASPKSFTFEEVTVGAGMVNDHATRKKLTKILEDLGFVKFRSGAGMRWKKAA
jgi:hypothetical protein